MRPRNVPEERRPDARLEPPQVPRHQSKMVVLDEHRGPLVRQLRSHGRREPHVDPLIRRPVLAAKPRADVHGVGERPEPLVREAIVVTPLILRREPDPPQQIGRRFRGDLDPIAGVDDLGVRVSGAGRDPDAAPFAHQRVERDRDAAGRRHGLNRTVRLSRVLVWLAVRYHDERTAELVLQQYLRHVRTRASRLPRGPAHSARLWRRKPKEH